ncbi:MAG: xanthine dehydrogenase, partial [Proteobacteria bacterium]
MAVAAAPEPQANMGEPAPRIDARQKVTGEARYASDFPLANPAYAVLVTSAIARGRLLGLDLEAAKAVPGVLDILTQDNTGELKEVKFGGASTSIQKLGPEIAHDGQIIAMVVADTFEAAREAAYKVKASYAAETPSASFDSPGVTAEDVTKVSERHKHMPQAGDADAALAGAEVMVEAQYGTPTQHHNPIELFTTACAWDDGHLTVYEPSQFVYGVKNALAKKTG